MWIQRPLGGIFNIFIYHTSFLEKCFLNNPIKIYVFKVYSPKFTWSQLLHQVLGQQCQMTVLGMHDLITGIWEEKKENKITYLSTNISKMHKDLHLLSSVSSSSSMLVMQNFLKDCSIIVSRTFFKNHSPLFYKFRWRCFFLILPDGVTEVFQKRISMYIPPSNGP